MAHKRLMKEWNDFSKNPIQGINIWMDPNDCFSWMATIQGGKNTPYEGGIWQLQVKIPKDYPFKPPKLKFLTKIYHPGITPDGDLCCCYTNNIVKHQWSPAITIPKVLQEYINNLDENRIPIIEDCGGGRQMHEQFKKDRNKFLQIAKQWTKKYASIEQTGAGPEVVECSICTQFVKAKEGSTKLCCGQMFHQECLQKWDTSKCPNCMQTLFFRNEFWFNIFSGFLIIAVLSILSFLLSVFYKLISLFFSITKNHQQKLKI